MDLIRNGCQIRKADRDGVTPLQYAAQNEDFVGVKLLLDVDIHQNELQSSNILNHILNHILPRLYSIFKRFVFNEILSINLFQETKCLLTEGNIKVGYSKLGITCLERNENNLCRSWFTIDPPIFSGL